MQTDRTWHEEEQSGSSEGDGDGAHGRVVAVLFLLLSLLVCALALRNIKSGGIRPPVAVAAAAGAATSWSDSAAAGAATTANPVALSDFGLGPVPEGYVKGTVVRLPDGAEVADL